MKENPKVQTVVESVFQAAVERLVKDDTAPIVSKIYVQLDAEAGEVQVYDEQEKLLKKKVIFDWADAADKGDSFTQKKLSVIRAAIAKVAAAGAFESPVFIRPFSICLADEEFQVIESLYSISDESAVDEGDLLKNLDKELDDFYEKLLLNVE